MTLKLNGSTSGSVALDAPADTSPSGTDVTLTLPTSAGSSGQYLQTDGAGALSWASAASLSNAEDGTGNNFEFNSGFGSNGVAYGCRAWCNANLTGSGSISGSGNVSSLTDRGTGRWQFHFATAMPDVNYAANGICKPNADIVNNAGIHPGTPGPGATWDTYSTGTVAFIYTNDSGTLIDPLIGSMTVHR